MDAMQQEKEASPGADIITVLTSAGPLLTKVWDSAVGKPQPYENVKQVKVQEVAVSNIQELSSLLSRLEKDPKSCVIRGRFVGEEEARKRYPEIIERDKRRDPGAKPPKPGFALRRKELFPDRPLHYFMIDIDGYRPEGIDPVTEPEAAIDQYITANLPSPFHMISYHWQLSSSAGHPNNREVLKAHVWFWLKHPYTGQEVTIFAEARKLPLDITVFREVQPNYTAAPVFNAGVDDPVPVRSGLCVGMLGDEVDLLIPALPASALKRQKKRNEMVDPSDKPGAIGAFCRAFSIEEVVERFLPDVFEFVTEDRLNYLLSPTGALEGAGVCDHRQGIFNTHDSDPFNGRAANKWDLVRHYKFGELDEGMDDDLKAMAGINTPSQEAMFNFANGLPEVQAELLKEVSAEEDGKADIVQSYRQAVDMAQDKKTLAEVAARISKESGLDPVDREILVSCMKSRLESVTGAKVGIGIVREMVAGSSVKSKMAGNDLPGWVEGWVYVTGEAKFFNLETKHRITKDAFDTAYGRYVGSEGEDAMPASRMACDVYQIPVVHRTMYLPTVGELFDANGSPYANEYRHSSVPSAAPLTEFTKKCFAVIDRHMRLLIPNAEYRSLFLQWAGWVVRNPGRKVRWAVYIKGVEGDGKSIVGALLRVAMGDENAGVVGPATIVNSNFNDWAGGRCLNVIEEIKMTGHNRHDAYNKIKTLITNDTVEMHPKGRPSQTIINTVNYIMFSNYKDGIPLDEYDRRVLVLFSPWENIGEFVTALAGEGVTIEDHWKQMWDEIIHPHPEVVRAYFEAIDISKFDPNSRAPATTFKDQVVNMEVDDDLAMARSIVESGGIGICREAVSSSCLTKALKSLENPIEVSSRQVRNVLSKLGYDTCVGECTKWNGSAHRLWINTTALNKWLRANNYPKKWDEFDESSQRRIVRKLLDATLAADFM